MTLVAKPCQQSQDGVVRPAALSFFQSGFDLADGARSSIPEDLQDIEFSIADSRSGWSYGAPLLQDVVLRLYYTM